MRLLRGRAGDHERDYERTREMVARVASDGEPPDAFWPGSHSLRADGKLVGLPQRVRQDVALTAGIVVVRDHDAIGAVPDPVYNALGVPFDPESVGSVARADGDADSIREAAETELVGDRRRDGDKPPLS